MRRCTRVVEAHLRRKHQQMRDTPFEFLRGSFYRWVQLWPTVCRELHRAPRVLAVGDLHVGSFGTWRDSEGRLCWGVDDFDESYPLPYTNDLVRLAASAKLLIDTDHLTIKLRDACAAILDGYRRTLRDGGLGSDRRVTSILADLRRRKSTWLRAAARDMAEAIEREWKAFRA